MTLEPIENQVDEAVDLLFLPRGACREDPVDVEAVEAGVIRRKRSVDGAIDLGAVATEFLLLGLDPYPRKPGAVFEAPPAGDPVEPSVRGPGGPQEGRHCKDP